MSKAKTQNDRPLSLADMIMFVMLISIIAYLGYSHFTGKAPSGPDFMVIDTDQVIDKRVGNGDTPAEASVYLSKLLTVYKQEGFLIVTNEAAIAYPDTMKAYLPSKAELKKKAAEMGIPFTQADYQRAEENIQSATDDYIQSLYKTDS